MHPQIFTDNIFEKAFLSKKYGKSDDCRKPLDEYRTSHSLARYGRRRLLEILQ